MIFFSNVVRNDKTVEVPSPHLPLHSHYIVGDVSNEEVLFPFKQTIALQPAAMQYMYSECNTCTVFPSNVDPHSALRHTW
jgi:hypothetical protein